MITRFFLFLSLVISNPLYCQIDSAKLDSLARRIASSHKLTSSYQDSFIKAQDSALQIAVSKGRQNNTSRDTRLRAGSKPEEKRYESRRYVRTVITALLLVFLVIGLLRLRKKSRQS